MPQRLHDKRDEPQPDSDGNKDEQRKQDRIHDRNLGVYHDISTDLRLAREDIAASLIFLGERILDRHAHAAPGELDTAGTGRPRAAGIIDENSGPSAASRMVAPANTGADVFEA